eukprot:PhF_6_TR11377/c0_g1_i1/m.18334
MGSSCSKTFHVQSTKATLPMEFVRFPVLRIEAGGTSDSAGINSSVSDMALTSFNNSVYTIEETSSTTNDQQNLHEEVFPPVIISVTAPSQDDNLLVVEDPCMMLLTHYFQGDDDDTITRVLSLD